MTRAPLITSLALAAALIAPTAPAATAAPAAESAPTVSVAVADAKAKKVTKKQARKAVSKVNKLGSKGKYKSMKKHASKKVVRFYKDFNKWAKSEGGRIDWDGPNTCVKKGDDLFESMSFGKGRIGCDVWATLVDSEMEGGSAILFLVKMKKGRPYVYDYNIYAG